MTDAGPPLGGFVHRGRSPVASEAMAPFTLSPPFCFERS